MGPRRHHRRVPDHPRPRGVRGEPARVGRRPARPACRGRPMGGGDARVGPTARRQRARERRGAELMASTAVATRPSAPAPATPTRPGLPTVVPQAQRWGAVTVAATAVGAAQVMVFAALLGAFFAARTSAGAWPPRNFPLDNYRAVTLLFTALLVTGMTQWAVHAARNDDQRHSLVGLGMAFGLELAMADLVWYTAQNINTGAGSSTFSALYVAILGTYFIACIPGIVALFVAGLRALGGQTSSEEHQPITAAALQVHTL